MTPKELYAYCCALPYAENGCQIWDKGLFTDGYPQAWVPGTSGRATRIVLAERLGRPLADKMEACHTCDVPACVNPAHLWEGTRKQNSEDMARKGRIAKEKHPRWGAKLTDETKAKIAAKHTGMSKPWLAGENNPMYGKGLRGEQHPMFGVKHSEEARRKMSEALRVRWANKKGKV